MKVLLIQLPVPNNTLSNLPLALGYLKASADAVRLPDLTIELMDPEAQDKGGDAFLVDAILARDPDMVGFSLYTWNSTRALHLARSIKAMAPEILLLGGGPEVNPDNNFILDEPAFDFLIFGEGERSFVELCRYFVQTQPPLHQISGLGFRKSALNGGNLDNTKPRIEIPLLPLKSTKNWVINPARSAIEDVNLIPSAYLSGVLEGYVNRFMSIELSRWCPSRCTFCYYGRQDLPRGGKRYFDVRRIKAEIEFGLAHGVEQFHFVEANFNTLPHLDRIFETIHQTGANHRAHFYAEMRGEAIDEAEASRLQSAGFDTVEVGLQSAVPEVLTRVRRKNNLPRLVRGVHLLRERGIEVFLDAILGLPGETHATFQQTLDFIDQNGLSPYDLFHLQVLSGTQLKAEALAGQHGLLWQDAPPYFVLQTGELSFEDLCNLRRECLERKGEDPAEIAGLPVPDLFALTNLPTDDTISITTNTNPIQRVVLDLTNPSFAKVIPEIPEISRKLASEVNLQIKLGQVTEHKLETVQAILAQLSRPNPHGVWHIFVESERVLTAFECARLTGAVQHEAGYLDRVAIFGLQEQDPSSYKQWPTLKLYNIVPQDSNFCNISEEAAASLVVHLHLDNANTVEEWRNIALQLLQSFQADLLLSFGSFCELAKIQAFLAGLDLSGRQVWFEDWRCAAGLASELNTKQPLRFPVTYWGSTQVSFGIMPQKLDKAALIWALGQRKLHKV